MTEPLLFARTLRVAPVLLLQALLPPLAVVATLYLLCLTYQVAFGGFFQVLAALAAGLTVLLPRGRTREGARFPGPPLPLAARVIVRWLVIVAIMLGIGYVTKYSSAFSRRVVLSWVLLTPLVLIVVTLALHELIRRVLHDPALARRVAFVGLNGVSRSLAARIERSPELGLSVQGFFDDRSADRLGVSGETRLLGALHDLSGFVHRRGIDVIFVALPVRHIRRVMDLLDELADTTASIYYVPDVLVFDLMQARTGEILGVPVVALCETPFCGYRGVFKRITDLALAVAILVCAAPVMLLLALAIKLSSSGPVLFRQRRYGLDGAEIIVYKFRTMRVVEDGREVPQARRGDARVTRLGRFLRRNSLDELPQLINVLQGRMSLVGPRPHAVAHNEAYRKLIKGYMFRYKVPPGITGLAQVNGCRGETARIEDMRARVAYDLQYLRYWSPLLDLKILALTALRLLNDQQAY
jgi:putative colanic acid biosysnthesis UDP-glucose lipid carrier transferase